LVNRPLNAFCNNQQFRLAEVPDVLAELQCPVNQNAHFESWRKLTEELVKKF
jgi:hypothetical protein